MTNENQDSLVSRRSAIKGLTMTVGAAAAGGAGIWFTSRGVSAAVSSSALQSGGAIQISSDGGDVTDIDLSSDTAFDLSWEGFDSDINSVTFTLEAQRIEVGTGSDETTATENLAADAGSTPTTVVTDSPTVLSPGRNGDLTYTSSDLASTFPFAIIDGGSAGANVEGVVGDANIDAASLSLASDGDTKVSRIEFTLTAEVASTDQSVTATTSGTLDVVVGNMATDAGTGGTITGSGSGE